MFQGTCMNHSEKHELCGTGTRRFERLSLFSYTYVDFPAQHNFCSFQPSFKTFLMEFVVSSIPGDFSHNVLAYNERSLDYFQSSRLAGSYDGWQTTAHFLYPNLCRC